MQYEPRGASLVTTLHGSVLINKERKLHYPASTNIMQELSDAFYGLKMLRLQEFCIHYINQLPQQRL